MNHQHKFNMDYIIFWSSLFAVLVLSHKINGILTESNDLHCTDIQCPTKCPEDSYLKSTMEDMEEDEFIDFEDEFISHFEELTPLVESHEEHPEHTVKERQKREVFFQDDIESCCGDQKCVCNECPDVPKCFQGYVAVRIHEGKGEPGNCCSQYRCLKKEECQMGVKQTWWTGKCTNCSCFGETEFCEQICREEEVVQNCYSEYLQKPLINGAIWKEGPCTKCTCEQGERRCFASICPKLNCKHTVTYDDVCCPKCVDDETDERIEIVHNQEVEEVGEEETNTETIELSINEELNSTEALENTSTDVIILSDNITSTPLVESVETNNSTSSQELTSTSPNSLESKIDEQFLDTTSSTETSTATSTSTLASSSAEEDVSLKYEHISSTILSSTFSDELHSELDSTTKSLLSFNVDVITSTTSTTTEEPKPEKELTEETTTAISSTTEVTASTTISAMPSSSDPNEETTTQISLETSSSTEVDLPTVSIMTSNVPTTTTSNITPLENVSTGSSSSTTAALESTTASSTSTETSPSTTTDNNSFSQMSSTLSSSTTETPVHPTTTDSSSSTTTTTTSTTSSPYSPALETSSVSPVKQLLEESSTTSTTSAPEPLMPLYQLYGEFNSDERISSTSTQNQMRILFDEIDYVVMIALFVGSLMCIAVGLAIRHAKNRKKMYSSVPNSETSLSQTSTVMTV